MTKMRVEQSEIANADIFEILLDHFPDMIHSVDDEGNILYTNRTAESLLGYTREELWSMNIRQLYAADMLDAVQKGFSELKQSGEKTVESVLRDRRGARIPVEIRSFSIYDDDGRFLRTFSIVRDLRRIKELQQGLVHAGRLAAIGEMASGVAHDINNPLTVIMLSNEMVRKELGRVDLPPANKKRAGKFVADVHKAAGSIRKLVEHLRNFSRGVAEKPERIDLAGTVADALFITHSRIQSAGVEVRREIAEGRFFVRGAPNRLEQVFVNLIANACDAMAGSTVRTLTISIAPVPGEEVACWKCDVSDTGGGIPAELVESVFESFFTTKQKGKGTGLGLSICRGIIHDHKGRIEVGSERGAGTTFSVYLPREAGETAAEG